MPCPQIWIRAEKLKRLRQLELQQAKKGIDTPAQVILEIQALKDELGLSVQVRSDELVNELGASDTPETNDPLVKLLLGEIVKARIDVDKFQDEVKVLKDQINQLEHKYDEFISWLQAHNHRAWLVLRLAIMATVVVAVGAVIVANDGYSVLGWFLVAVGVALEILAYLEVRQMQK